MYNSLPYSSRSLVKTFSRLRKKNLVVFFPLQIKSRCQLTIDRIICRCLLYMCGQQALSTIHGFGKSCKLRSIAAADELSCTRIIVHFYRATLCYNACVCCGAFSYQTTSRNNTGTLVFWCRRPWRNRSPSMRAPNTSWVGQIGRFSTNISLYLRNGASYYRTLIRTRVRSVECWYFHFPMTLSYP